MSVEQYVLGTVSVEQGTPTVTGSGTLWDTAILAGNVFKLDLDGDACYEIASVDSDTQITLSVNYAGDTSSGEPYMVQRSFTPTFNLARPHQGDADLADILRTQVIDKIDALLAGLPPDHAAVAMLYRNFTQYTSPADTDEHDAKVYSMPANTMDIDHMSLRITVTGINGANSAVMKFRVGATLVSFYSLAANKAFKAIFTVGRRGASSEVVASYYDADDSSEVLDRDVITEDLTTALDVKATVATSGGGGGVIVDGMTVELLQ